MFYGSWEYQDDKFNNRKVFLCTLKICWSQQFNPDLSLNLTTSWENPSGVSAITVKVTLKNIVSGIKSVLRGVITYFFPPFLYVYFSFFPFLGTLKEICQAHLNLVGCVVSKQQCFQQRNNWIKMHTSTTLQQCDFMCVCDLWPIFPGSAGVGVHRQDFEAVAIWIKDVFLKFPR